MPERREERFAFEVLRRALGATVDAHDDGSRPRMVDGLFELPSGRLGAVEVTTVGDERALQLEHILDRQIHIDGGRWGWHVWVPYDVRKRDLARHLVPLLRECEAQGAGEPDLLRPTHALEAAFRWWTGGGLHAHAVSTSAHPGRVLLVAGVGDGGMVPADLTGFPEWLGEQLAGSRFDGERSKLAATGRPERHLFLRVHDSWLPMEFDAHVAWEMTLPSAELAAPDEVTAVWLGARWAKPMLWWSRDGGWARFDLPATEEP